MALFTVQTNVLIYEEFLDPVPNIYLFYHLHFSIVLAALEFRILFLKIKKASKGKQTTLSCHVFLWKVKGHSTH